MGPKGRGPKEGRGPKGPKGRGPKEGTIFIDGFPLIFIDGYPSMNINGYPVLWNPVLWDPVLWNPVLWNPVLWNPVLWKKPWTNHEKTMTNHEKPTLLPYGANKSSFSWKPSPMTRNRSNPYP
jgi:hypothetical protein